MSGAASRFNVGGLDALKARVAQKPDAAAGPSEARRIALALIDEDPDQPRKQFDHDQLVQMADTIRSVGVLQPVGVQPVNGGRYLLRWGARRVRASALAGLVDVPAVLVGREQAGIEAQVIENAQRTGNSPAEIAAAIEVMTGKGMSNERIAAACALHAQELKHYRALAKLREVPCLAACMDARTQPRALYELWQVWQKADGAHQSRLDQALTACPELTLATARRLLAQVEADIAADAAGATDAAGPMDAADAATELPVGGAALDGTDAVVQAAAGAAVSPPTDATTVAPESTASAERPARHRSAAPTAPSSEDEREDRVRAWLELPRPRPRLAV